MNQNELSYGDVVLVNQHQPDDLENGDKMLPAVIISANILNATLDSVMVCPLVEAKYISQSKIGATFVPKDVIGLEEDSLVLSLQILTVFQGQIFKRLGSLPDVLMKSVQTSLKSALNLENEDLNIFTIVEGKGDSHEI